MKPHKILIAALAALALTSCSSPEAQQDSPAKSPDAKVQQGPMSEAIDKLKIADEDATSGYSRSKFGTTVKRDDGCDTRKRVLIAEATSKPEVTEPGCTLKGGEWTSYLDGITTEDPREMVASYTVPLAEAWKSGASEWTAEEMNAYANDVDYAPTMTAVSAQVSAKRGDKDPARWMPPREEANCVYAGNWIATKLRYQLAADQAEVDALKSLKDCSKLVMQWKGSAE